MTWKHIVAAVGAMGWMSAPHAQAASTDWAAFGKFLSLMQVLMQATEASCAPNAGCDPQQAIDDMLHGKNPEANQLGTEIFADMPSADRAKLLSLGRSMVTIARSQGATQEQRLSDDAAIRARKDLTAMGLTYHDAGAFLDAVRRNDRVAVRLFLAGRGVNPDAKDVWGNSALDIAKQNGDREMIALLSAAPTK